MNVTYCRGEVSGRKRRVTEDAGGRGLTLSCVLRYSSAGAGPCGRVNSQFQVAKLSL